MISVAVNDPKTPVTEGSMDMAPATLPNVCKMPGPPAPFVPTPLPNFGRSADRLTDGTTTVKIEGKKVAIKGSYYKSQPSPDVASQGTGGGLISSAVQGKTEFAAPGSMDVKADGKNIQLLGDAMTNNGGSPSNAATVPGNQQPPAVLPKMPIKCDAGSYDSVAFSDCDKKQICAKCAAVNKQAEEGSLQRQKVSGTALEKEKADAQKAMRVGFEVAIRDKMFGESEIRASMYDDCAYDEQWKPKKDPGFRDPMFDPDHVHEVQLGGLPASQSNFKWMAAGPNRWMGSQLKNYDPAKFCGVEPDCC
jgi:uncharacterized Zn-binding protein involved in type VI secretion